MATGANTTPLGPLHPILAARLATQSTGLVPTPISGADSQGSGSKDPELKRHLEAAKRAASALFTGNSAEPPKKKRRSRWGSEQVKSVIPGLPSTLPANMKEDEQKLYIMHLKIEEIGRMLRTGDLGVPANPSDRSPSPEPIYSHDGKRLNTREVRVRKKLEDERHELVQQAINLNPEYRAPTDYKPPNKKFEDKVFIPQDHHPETNFVGLLIGPRGHTLKQLERDSQTKIMIRGKGATKEGKLGRAGLPQPGEDEPLHALITGNTPEAVKTAVDKIKNIIQSGIDVPGNDNDLKKLQLQQLAELNGTFKPLDILKCRNCGSASHKSWECTEQQNVTSSVICSRCGGGGHIASDCMVDLSALPSDPMNSVNKEKMDSEYLSLMKELGESVPGGGAPNGPGRAGSKAGVGVGGAVPPPMIPGQPPPWMQHPQFPPHMAPHGPPHHMMMPPHPGAPAPIPWGAPPPPGQPPYMGGPPPPMSMPPPPPPGTTGTAPSSVPPTSATSTDSAQQQPSGASVPPPLPPWQQAPPAAPPQGQVPAWQQPMMYGSVPAPLPAMGAAPPPLPPGTPGAPGVPPPPPPEQNWVGAPPPPPPPPPAESSS